MKTKFPFILLLTASLTACTSTTTKTTSQYTDDKSKGARYAANSFEPSALDEQLQNDIPREGPAPANFGDNPAYMPTPLLRQSAAGGP
jgi:hypothetical protein